jgi:hypothetical protein
MPIGREHRRQRRSLLVILINLRLLAASIHAHLRPNKKVHRALKNWKAVHNLRLTKSINRLCAPPEAVILSA